MIPAAVKNITNIQSSTVNTSFDALSKWHDLDVRNLQEKLCSESCKYSFLNCRYIWVKYHFPYSPCHKERKNLLANPAKSRLARLILFSGGQNQIYKVVLAAAPPKTRQPAAPKIGWGFSQKIWISEVIYSFFTAVAVCKVWGTRVHLIMNF